MNIKEKNTILVLGIVALFALGGATRIFNKEYENLKALSIKVEGDTSSDSKSSINVVGGESAYLDFDDGSITWVDANDIIVTYTLAAGISSDVKPDCLWSIEFSSNLATYVDASAVSGTWASGVAITLPTITYKEGKNPTTIAQYDEMYSLLSDSNEGVTLKVKVDVK